MGTSARFGFTSWCFLFFFCCEIPDSLVIPTNGKTGVPITLSVPVQWEDSVESVHLDMTQISQLVHCAMTDLHKALQTSTKRMTGVLSLVNFGRVGHWNVAFFSTIDARLAASQQECLCPLSAQT